MKGSLIVVLILAAAVAVLASSHSEAPGQLRLPQVDATDLYAFMSYEAGREGYVTVLALFGPLQHGFAGPNYYSLSNAHFYEILVDNQGTGKPSTIIQFDANSELPSGTGFELTIGTSTRNATLAVPLKFVGPITESSQGALNWEETYKINVIDSGVSRGVLNPRNGGDTFIKPFDYAGNKTFPNYRTYSDKYIYTINWPIARCAAGLNQGKVFVGQRKDPFYIYLGGVFDLVNFIPVDNLAGGFRQNASLFNQLRDFNAHVFAVEIHKSCLLRTASDTNLGFWTRSRNKKTGAQPSRMGNPLVNELLIGLDDKDLWNRVTPDLDQQFNSYLQYPTFPKLLDILFLATVKTLPNFGSLTFIEPQYFPRNDLLAVFHTGIPGLNQLPLTVEGKGAFADLLRLNTAIPAVNYTTQAALAVLANDFAGWPNGRRPKDDVVDIALRASMGAVLKFGGTTLFPGLKATDIPVADVAFTDFTPPSPQDYIDTFPYCALPVRGNLPNIA